VINTNPIRLRGQGLIGWTFPGSHPVETAQTGQNFPKGLVDWSAGRNRRLEDRARAAANPVNSGCNRQIAEGRQPQPFWRFSPGGAPSSGRGMTGFKDGNRHSIRQNHTDSSRRNRGGNRVTRPGRSVLHATIGRHQELKSSALSLMRIISSLAGLSIQVFWNPAQFSQTARGLVRGGGGRVPSSHP
jgi:hypothetical protein